MALGPEHDDPARELRRVVARLVTLGPDRVGRAGAQGRVPAEDVREVLTWLAEVSADAEGQPRRAVPVLAERALADQLSVLVHDALAVADPALDARVLDRLVELRRTL